MQNCLMCYNISPEFSLKQITGGNTANIITKDVKRIIGLKKKNIYLCSIILKKRNFSDFITFSTFSTTQTT